MASIATPSAQGFDFNSLKPVIQWVQTFILGLASGVVMMYLTGFKDEFFDKRKWKLRRRIDVANEVHKLCVEASTHSFRKPARNQEHVMSVLTDVESIDRRMGKIMNRFVTLWSLVVIELGKDKTNARREDYVHLTEMTGELEEKRKVLKDWANRIRAGGKPR